MTFFKNTRFLDKRLANSTRFAIFAAHFRTTGIQYPLIKALRTMKDFAFQIEMKTRDYECDVQGVVNNANYQHYLEVTRHEFIQSVGESFEHWHNEGIDVMVSKITINYKSSLHGGEEFVSCLNLKRTGVRYI